MSVLAFPGPKQRPPDGSAEVVAFDDTLAPAFGGDAPPPKYDRITFRAITVAVVLSLLVHFVMFLLPAFNPIEKEQKAPADELGPLTVTIANSTPPPPAPQFKPEPPAQQREPSPTPQKPVAKPVPTPAKPPPQIAVSGARPPFVVPPPVAQQPAPIVQPQPVKPTTDDFAEALAARQAARRAANGGAPDEVVESESERANRIAKGNVMAQQRSASPGQDPEQSGGIFELKHTGIDDAEFVFNGWNRDFRRGMGKTFEVRTGNNPDIRLAVIRQMIQIIREQQPGDFQWYSHRLQGKSIVMSARVKDQPELELFLMKEFYPQDPRAQAK